jgi:hypothetical protein
MPTLVALLLCIAGTASAQPITDRNFAIDFYDGVALGNTTQVGMGGAGAAYITGSAGTLINASAPVIRNTTDRGAWSWDYHLDALTATLSSDYDNNGVTSEDGGASFLTGGLSVRYNHWAIAATVTAQTAPVIGSDPDLDAEAFRGKLVLSHWFSSADLAIGAGIQQLRFGITNRNQDPDVELFAMGGSGAIVGLTWVPKQRNVRIAAAVESPILGGTVETSTCDPDDCNGYILPEKVESAGRLVGGIAYRIGPTPWNSVVLTPFRDERSLTFAADVVVTGPTRNGFGIEAFGMQQLQRSGSNTDVSLRFGVDTEVIPGRLKLRAGTYWEPSRFDDVSGRLHATVGMDIGVLNFRFWGPRRVRVSGTADLAPRYRNIGLSIGFWSRG